MAAIDPSVASVQLYTVREALTEDLPGTLARLARMGLRQVEPFAFTDFPGLAAGLREHGLTAPTAHQNLFGTDPRAAFEAAGKIGVDVVIDPFAPPEHWTDAASVRATADEINRLAALAAGFGLRFGYHNHHFEFEATIDGVSAYEVFADALDPAVLLEVDTYWAAAAGQDVPALLRRLGDRVVALHVKDGPPSLDVKDQVAAGRGALPVAAFLDAAPGALRVIELDDSRGDRFAAVRDSLHHLAALAA